MSVFIMKRGVAPSIAPSVNLVNYIGSSGTQYIDTGYKPNSNTKIVVEVSGWPRTEKSTTLFGTQSGSSDRYDVYISSGGAYRSYYGGSYVALASTVSYPDRVKIVKDGASVTIGESSLTNTAKTFTCTTPLYLFAHYNNGSVANKASFDLYYCQIYDNGTLVRDLWPCYDPDGVACLYDKVSESYYRNIGTGSFTAG